MNCKQFKHSKRVEKKQQFSFNPAEVNYDNSFVIKDDYNTVKPIENDISLKKALVYLLSALIIISTIKSLIFN